MDKIIDLMSSDDETTETTVPASTSTTAASEAVNTTDISKDNLTTTTVESAVETVEDPSSPSTSSNITVLRQQETTRPRHGRRKSTHLHTRSSPEIEFLSNETLTETAAQSNSNTNTFKSQGANITAKKKTNKISILAQKPITAQQLFDAAFDDFLKNDSTLFFLRKIAAERLRVNKLLEMNSMPEIKFSLYTQPEVLEFQLTDRFRQHDIRSKSLSTPKRNNSQ